jgi:hypothetical protein
MALSAILPLHWLFFPRENSMTDAAYNPIKSQMIVVSSPI